VTIGNKLERDQEPKNKQTSYQKQTGATNSREQGTYGKTGFSARSDFECSEKGQKMSTAKKVGILLSV